MASNYYTQAGTLTNANGYSFTFQADGGEWFYLRKGLGGLFLVSLDNGLPFPVKVGAIIQANFGQITISCTPVGFNQFPNCDFIMDWGLGAPPEPHDSLGSDAQYWQLAIPGGQSQSVTLTGNLPYAKIWSDGGYVFLTPIPRGQGSDGEGNILVPQTPLTVKGPCKLTFKNSGNAQNNVYVMTTDGEG